MHSNISHTIDSKKIILFQFFVYLYTLGSSFFFCKFKRTFECCKNISINGNSSKQKKQHYIAIRGPYMNFKKFPIFYI